MSKRGMLAAWLLAAAAAAPAAAQTAPTRFSLTPYAAYGFYGRLPDDGPDLKEAPAFGVRAAYHLSPQLALYGNFQRSQPEVESLGGGDARVDHWSAGVEFSYAPRGGAENVIPLNLEAGIGQVRYDFPGGVLGDGRVNDLAANVGISSALSLGRNLAIRWGVNDYISNFQGDSGLANQVFVNAGVELSF
jgi:hypothetical protein